MLAAVWVERLVELTLQDVSLRGGRFTCALQRSAVDKVKADAEGKLLLVLVGRVGSRKVREVEALGDTPWVGYRRAENEIPCRIDLCETTFPKLWNVNIRTTYRRVKTYQCVGKLYVNFADLDSWWRLPQRRQVGGLHTLLRGRQARLRSLQAQTRGHALEQLRRT